MRGGLRAAGPVPGTRPIGDPLLWPWPWDLFQNGLSRREELLLGAAMLLIAAERLDHRAPGREQRHLQAVSATVPEVGQ